MEPMGPGDSDIYSAFRNKHFHNCPLKIDLIDYFAWGAIMFKTIFFPGAEW